MSTPDNLRFLESHEWIQTGAEIVAVGISDHAQSELSEVVFVELPEVGREVTAHETVAVVESVKAASDIYSPASGVIVEVNEALNDEPSLINRDPFGEGWLFKIKLSAPSELDALLDPAAYEALLG